MNGTHLRVGDANPVVKGHNGSGLCVRLGEESLSCSFDLRIGHKHPESHKSPIHAPSASPGGESEENSPSALVWVWEESVGGDAGRRRLIVGVDGTFKVKHFTVQLLLYILMMH